MGTASEETVIRVILSAFEVRVASVGWLALKGRGPHALKGRATRYTNLENALGFLSPYRNHVGRISVRSICSLRRLRCQLQRDLQIRTGLGGIGGRLPTARLLNILTMNVNEQAVQVGVRKAIPRSIHGSTSPNGAWDSTIFQALPTQLLESGIGTRGVSVHQVFVSVHAWLSGQGGGTGRKKIYSG
jgi:hypothetical protein